METAVAVILVSVVALAAMLALPLAKTRTVAGAVLVLAPLTYVPAFIWGERQFGFFDLALARDILLAVLIANWTLRGLAGREKLGLFKESVFWLALLSWAALFIARGFMPDLCAACVSATPGQEWSEWARLLRHLVLYPVFLVLVMADITQGEEHARDIFGKVLITSVLVMALALADNFYGLGHNPWRQFESPTTTYLDDPGRLGIDQRAVSVLLNPNNLAAYIGFCLSLVFGFNAARPRRPLLGNRLWLVYFVLAAVAMTLTLSRGAAASFAIVMLYLAWSSLRARGRFSLSHGMALKLTLGLALTVAAFTVALLVRRGGLVLLSASLTGRIAKFTNLLQLTDSPLGLLFGATIRAGTDVMYARVLSYLGVLGFLLFCGVIYLAFRRLTALRNTLDDSTRPYANAALCGLLFVVAWGFASESFGLFPVNFLVWSVVGVAFGLGRGATDSRRYSSQMVTPTARPVDIPLSGPAARAPRPSTPP